MSPRTRKIDDHDIAEFACALLVEAGAGAVTFAEVAKRCGLAPPTLVQRFGSRQGMLSAAANALPLRVTRVFRETAQGALPLSALRAALQQLATVQSAACQLASVADLAAYSLELRKQISFTLVAATGAGELPHCDIARLARTIQISFAGAVAAAELERGDVAFEVRNAIDAQLADYI